MKLLLEAGADPNFVSDIALDGTEKPNSWFPIHNAAAQLFSGHLDNKPANWDMQRESAVKLLLDYGADYFAAYADSSHALQCIIEQHGVVGPILESKTLDTEHRGKGGRTLLISACVPKPMVQTRHGFREPEPPEVAHAVAALLLLERGASVHATDNLGRTPLHWLCTMKEAFEERHMEVLRELFIRDPSIIHVKDNEGYKPYHLSLLSHADWATQYLLDHGASPSEPDIDGNLALHLLASRLVGERVGASAAAVLFQKFLAMGLDINARNKRGETPIFIFLSTSHSSTYDSTRNTRQRPAENDVFHCDSLELFIEAGADLFTATDDGATLLHITAQRHIDAPHIHGKDIQDVTDIFERLIQLGLDPKKEDKKLRTSIDIAVAMNKRDIVDLFTDEGKKRRELAKDRQRRAQS